MDGNAEAVKPLVQGINLPVLLLYREQALLVICPVLHELHVIRGEGLPYEILHPCGGLVEIKALVMLPRGFYEPGKLGKEELVNRRKSRFFLPDRLEHGDKAGDVPELGKELQ